MFKTYTPADWYWRADDGRVFSSARQGVITASDDAFIAWSAIADPTPWPKDDNGAQTDAALLAVLAPFGLYLDLKAYAADVRYREETGGAVVNGSAYLTDRETQAKMTAAVVMTQVNPAVTLEWKLADRSFVSLDAADMLQVAQAVGAHVQEAFAKEATVVAGINAGTITTKAQVDAAFSGETP